MTRLLVTAPPPTPNGRLHLGHAAGPYLAADLAARHARAGGVEVTTVCGLDTYQDYVDAAARAAGLPLEDYVSEMSSGIRADFALLDVFWDVFSEPQADPRYQDDVRARFHALVERGAITRESRPLSHCAECQDVVQYAGASGGCPHCGTPSGGGPCEGCARYTPSARLTSAISTCCSARLIPRITEVLVFRPRAGWDGAERLWLPQMRSGSPLPLIRRALTMPAADLPDGYVAAIPSRLGTRGVVVAYADEEYVVDVWVEMGLFYAALAEGLDRTTQLWHFLGLDNAWFYCGLFPALYSELDVWSPASVSWVVNYFLLLDGQKFSTSRQHAIWVKDAAGSKGLRATLAAHYPSSPGISLASSALDCPPVGGLGPGLVSVPLTPDDFDPRIALQCPDTNDLFSGPAGGGS